MLGSRLQQRCAIRAQRLHYSTSLVKCEAAAAEKENIAMPTPMSIGFETTYQKANESGGKRPLVIVAGWLGAKPKQLKPYLNFYHERNMDTISFAVGPHHVLDPKKGMAQMEKLLSTVTPQLGSDEEKKDVIKIDEPSALVFHHFSVGGYLYGQCLIAMNRDLEQLQVHYIHYATLYTNLWPSIP